MPSLDRPQSLISGSMLRRYQSRRVRRHRASVQRSYLTGNTVGQSLRCRLAAESAAASELSAASAQVTTIPPRAGLHAYRPLVAPRTRGLNGAARQGGMSGLPGGAQAHEFNGSVGLADVRVGGQASSTGCDRSQSRRSQDGAETGLNTRSVTSLTRRHGTMSCNENASVCTAVMARVSYALRPRPA